MSMSPTRIQTRARGFSLIELMITVLIIAVLAAISLPIYQNHVVKTRRAAATACLLEMGQFMERYYTTNLTYVGAALPASTCRNDLAPFYTIALDGAATAAAYGVTATAVGTQASRDTTCGNLGLNQAGTRSVSSGSVDECW
jgi:type IV pilus assembly protein PilE